MPRRITTPKMARAIRPRLRGAGVGLEHLVESHPGQARDGRKEDRRHKAGDHKDQQIDLVLHQVGKNPTRRRRTIVFDFVLDGEFAFSDLVPGQPIRTLLNHWILVYKSRNICSQYGFTRIAYSATCGKSISRRSGAAVRNAGNALGGVTVPEYDGFRHATGGRDSATFARRPLLILRARRDHIGDLSIP